MADNSTRIVITAEDKTRQAFESVRAGLDGVGRSASTIAATVAGMAGLGGILSGAGISAMVKQSIDAADAMNDLSQRIGIAVQDLAKYELAAKQSGTSMEAIARGVKGLAGSMLEHGDALKKAGITARDADGAMRQLADLFSRMPDGIEKTVLATKLFGKAGMDLIPMLNMGSKGLDESAQKSERYAAAMALLAPQADKFNDQMAEIALSGKMLGLTLANEVMPTLGSVADELGKVGITGEVAGKFIGDGLVEAFKAIAVLGANVAFTFRAVGTEIGGMAAQLAALGRGDIKGFSVIGESMKRDAEAARKEFDEFQDRILKIGSDVGAAAAAATSKPAAATKKAAKDAADAMDDWRKKVDALLAALNGGKTAVDEFAAVMNRINAKDSGVDASFWKDLNTLHAGYKAGRVDADAYADAVRNLTNQQGFAKDAAKAAAEIEETIWKAREKAREEAERSLTTLQGEIEQQQRHNEEIGLTAAGLAELTDRRMQDAIATKEQEFAKRQAEGADLAELKLIDEQIGALEKLRQLKSDGAARQAVADSAKQAADEWKRFSDDIERALTDSLMRGFENGESFGENFVKSLQNTLKTTVLKMVVQAIVSPVMGGLGQMMGVPGAGGSTGGIGSLLNLGNQGASAYNNYMNPGIGAGLSSLYGSFATSSIGQSLGLSTATAAGYAAPVYEAGALVSAGSGTAAGGMTAAGMSGAGMISSISTAMPYIAAAMVIADASGMFKAKGGPQSGQYGTLTSKGYSSQFTMSGGDNLGNQALAETAYAQVSSLYQMAGKKVGDMVLEQGYKLDPQGSAAGVAYRRLSIDGKSVLASGFDGNNGGQWYGAKDDAAGAAGYLGKLQTGEILAVVKAIGDAEFTATVAKLAANFKDLPVGLTQYTAAQATQKQLLAAMATDDERQNLMLAEARKALDSTFADLGQTVPASAAGFRELVSGLDLTTQAGQDTLAKLTGVSDAFLRVANSAKQVESDRLGWQQRLDVLEGDYTDKQLDRFMQLAGTSDTATKALMQQVWALEDQAEAAKLAADALAELSARAASVKSSAYGAYSGLLSATGNEKGALEFNVSAAQEAYQQALAAVAGNAGISSAAAQGYIDANGGIASAAAKYWSELGGAQDEATIRSKELLTDLVNAASGVAQAQNALKGFGEQGVASISSQVADDTARAQQQIRDEWQRTADSIFDTIRKLRGDVASPAQSYAAAQAQFSIATAAARAGDQGAAGQLPQLAQSVVDLGKSIAVTRVDQQLLTARTIASLSATMEGMRQFGIEIPAFASGGYHAGGLRLVGENGPELEATGSARIYNFDQTRDMLTGGGDMRGMRQELIALRRELAALRADNSAENRAIASATAKTAKTMERFDDGDALTVRVSA